MQINIKATKMELTPAIKDYIEEKMNMLEKYLGKIKVVKVDFEVALDSNHHNKGEIYRAELNLEIPHELLRVEKTESDLYKAMDKVKDHMTEIIIERKERMIEKNRQQ